MDAAYIRRVDRPAGHYDVEQTVDWLRSFNGHVIIQTLFMRGEHQGESIDNTGEEYVGPWLRALQRIAPQEVMVYTIDRETPAQGLLKATREQLDGIKQRVTALGIPCTASY